MRRSLVVSGAVLALLVPVVVATAQTTPPLRLVTVASKAQNAVFLAFAPGEPNRRYIVDKVGFVYITERGKVRAKPFLDVRRLVTAGGEQGLLGLAFHPNYKQNRLFYVAYTSATGRNVVARFRSNGTAAIPTTRKTLLSVPDPYGNHNGGNLVFGPDRQLYTTIGDGGSGGDPENRSQDMSSQFGKLLRLNVDRAGATWEIAALGLRNAWRFSFDRRTGDLWIGDVGQGRQGGDRLRRPRHQRPPQLRLGRVRGAAELRGQAARARDARAAGARVSHDDGCSVTGGYVYRGRAIPRVSGRYFFGDYCSATIWSLKLVNGKATDLRQGGGSCARSRVVRRRRSGRALPPLG